MGMNMNPPLSTTPPIQPPAAHKTLRILTVVFNSLHHGAVLLFWALMIAAAATSTEESSAGGFAFLVIFAFFPWVIGAIATLVVDIMYLAVIKPKGIALGLIITSIVALLFLPAFCWAIAGGIWGASVA